MHNLPYRWSGTVALTVIPSFAANSKASAPVMRTAAQLHGRTISSANR